MAENPVINHATNGLKKKVRNPFCSAFEKKNENTSGVGNYKDNMAIKYVTYLTLFKVRVQYNWKQLHMYTFLLTPPSSKVAIAVGFIFREVIRTATDECDEHN